MIIKFLRERFNSIKICAVFTAVSFMISTLGANLYAIPMAENTNKKYEDVFNRMDCISNEYGKITSSKDSNSDITVINIQDLHCHPQTQKNISKIIAQIADKYNLKKIYVEGGYGDIDVSWLNSIKDEDIRKQVIEKLFNEGMLTGSEYYKLTNNNSKVELKGIDEEEIHKDNVKRLSWIISQQNKYKKITEKVNKEIEILENTHINDRNKRFSRSIEEYSLNKIDSKKFYKQLIKYVKNINSNPEKYNNITAIRLEDYPNITKFMTLRKVSKDINIKQVTQQLQIIVNEFKNRLPYEVYTRFLRETENLSNSQKVLELIILLCAKENINLERYKSLNDFLQTNFITKNLNPIELVQEERQLIIEIRKALSYNNEEYEITFLSDFNKYFQDYLEYKLTDASWKYFEQHYLEFRQIYGKYATIDRIKEIEDDFNEINKYYDINDQRNNIFVRNLLKDEKIHLMANNKLRQEDEMLKSSKDVIIAVTGGFHSSELEQLLAKNDVNTIVITPKIYEDIKQANDKYIELIGLQSRVKSQALSYTVLSSVTDVDKQKILMSVLKDLFGGNEEKVKEVLGKDADLSLLDEKQIINTKEKSEIRNIIETTVDRVLAVIPQQGMKDIFVPDIDDIMLNMAEQLVRHGFYFSEGMIFDIENSNLKGQDLKGIPAEIYSRMLPSLQKALLEVSKKYEEVEQDIHDLYEDTGATESAYIYLEDINNNYQNFVNSLQDAITNKKLIVLHVFRNPIDISSFDREEQQKLYHNIRDMFFKIYTDKPLNKENFVSVPENQEFIDYDIHFFLLEILENSFMHGNIGLDKPIFVYMDKNEQNEIKTLRIYNRNNPQDDSAQMRIIRMKLALLGGLHKSNVLMKQNPYRTFEVDNNFKGKFYRTASDIKPSYDDNAAMQLREIEKNLDLYGLLSIFAPLSDSNKVFNTFSKIPHIWEEIVFRVIPVSFAILSMSFPAISFLSIPVGLIFFTICQNQFIKAHNISNWISQNNFTWKTSDIIKATLFNVFPNEELKADFEKYAQQTEIKSQTRSRFLPTLLLSVPYLYSLFFAPSIAVVGLAAIVGVFVHKYLNLILKNKLNIFDEIGIVTMSPDDDFKIDSNYTVSLKNSDDAQKLFLVLNGRKLSKEEAEILTDIILSNVEQYGYFINLLQQIRNRFIGNVELLVETLAERIDITNNNQINFFKTISENLTLKWNTVLPALFKRLDLNNDANVSLIKYFISKNQYNSELSGIIAEKADFNNKNHLAILNDLQSINDGVLSVLMNKADVKNVEHLSLILNSLLKASYLSSFQKIFSNIIKEINLSDKQTLEVFSAFMRNNGHILDDNNIKLLIQKISFEADEQIELLESVLKKNTANIDLVFDILLTNNINLNDTRYSKIFKIIIDKMLSKYSSYKDARKYFDKNIFLLPANSVQGKYAFSSLIDLLHNELIAHQNRHLKIVNGRMVVRVKEDGTDPVLDSIFRFAQDIETRKEMFDSELKARFDGFMRDLNFLKEMESRTSKRSYTRNRKVTDSIADNLTIEEFCKEKGFSLMKQTPNVFFDSRRYSFTGVLNFISKKLFGFRPSHHNPTYIMTKDTVDAEKLDGVISQFDAYMNLLDENLYILNKIDGLTAFDSQFDDVVNHIILMIDYLEQISYHGISSFRMSLKNILEEIKNNNTTIAEQKKIIESQSGNLIKNIPTINTLVNRIHQQANMSFVMTVMSSLSDYENAGYNTLVSKNDNLISVYNLSSNDISPQVEKFLSDLAENPDFSTDVKTPIFVKDNIVLWVASLGVHSVRILIDFNEETKSILVDFHEGAIGDGNTTRIKMLDSILTSMGFKVEKSIPDFEAKRLPSGIVAKLNKDVGLTSSMDFGNAAKQAVILFNNAASLNNLISNKFQIKHNINVAKLAIMDIYSRYYALSYIRSNFVRTRLNTRRNLNKILKSLELPLIPRKERGFWTFLKIGQIRVGFIKTYGQNTIDKYLNKPIEQAFATGYLKINDKGELERNKDYNPIASMSNKMMAILEKEVGQPEEVDMLDQGALISQMPEGEMNFKTVGQIGGYVLKTGYIKLNNGRLDENTKGEFLAVTILTDKNGIIRYTSSEIVGYPENMNTESGRMNLNSQQLEQLLKTEKYDISSAEKLTKLELLNYRSKIQERIIKGDVPVTYGTIISSPKEQKNTIFARLGEKTGETSLYLDKYASPENVTEAAKYDVSLFAGGSYSSHAGIVLREYGKTAMIVNDSQFVNNKMRIKFYQPKGDVVHTGNLETLEMEEHEIELAPNDIVLIDIRNNKMVLFESKMFKKGKVGNVLFELQRYIDKQNVEKVKEFINKYKNSTIADKIIEYIYYQSADNPWLEPLLDVENKAYKTQPSIITHRTIVKIVLQITDFVKHTSKNAVYKFGEKQSLDASKVGTKSANQSKLFLTLEQLKKETGIKNVAVPEGLVIGYDILEKLLGEKYTELYTELEEVVTDEFLNEEEKSVSVRDITAEIKSLIQNLSEEDIINYIGTENLELFKNKLAIVRSSGVGEDSQEYSAAGIAESFGSVQYDNISKAVKDSLLSFFSSKAMDYMVKSSNIIKPALLIEEWLEADKAGVMMSEDTNGKRIIQAVNGQCDDVVSGRKNPYTFIIDIKSGTKIDGNYTNTKTLTNKQLEQLTRIMEWLEQTEGTPVDIEFLINNGVIYIVQVRPITTLKKQSLKVLPRSLFTSVESAYEALNLKQKNRLSKDVETIKQNFKQHKYNEAEIEGLLKDFINAEKEFLDADKENYNVDLTSFIKSKEDLVRVTTLLKELLKLKITKLETENNMLGLKIFFNPKFNRIIDRGLENFFDKEISFVQKYYIALSISRFLGGIIDISKSDYDVAQFNDIVKVATGMYIAALGDQKDRVVADKNTRFISLAAVSSYDQPFEDAGLKKLLEVMDIPYNSDKVSLINADFVPATDAKSEFLRLIAALQSEDSVFISFDGHGFPNSLEVGFNAEISSEEFAKALIQAYSNGMDLSKITINLSSCFSWYFANNIYDALNKEFDRLEQKGNVVNRQFPVIWASAGHETVYGYSTYYRDNNKLTPMSNEWNGLLTSISQSKPENITVKNLLQAMTVVGYSNPTLFVHSDFVQNVIESGTDQILEIDSRNKTFEQSLTIGERLKKLFKLKNLHNNHINFFELSVFAPLKDENKLFNILDRTAHIWEEIFFRTLPIALTLLPVTSFISVPLTLILFSLLQIQFVRAHNITLWIKHNQLDWSTGKILKAVLFNAFPSEDSKHLFNFDQKMSLEEQTKGKILSAIGLSVPYLASLWLNANIPVIILVSVIGIVVHRGLNYFSKDKKESKEYEDFFAKFMDDTDNSLPSLQQFLADKEFIDLENEQQRQELIEILDKLELSEEETSELAGKIDLNDINQCTYLLKTFSEQKSILTNNRMPIVTNLVQNADINNQTHFDFISKLLLETQYYNVDLKTAYILLEKLDFSNIDHVMLLTDFLKSKTYDESFQNVAFNSSVAEKLDVNDPKQLKMLELFSEINENALYYLVSNFDFAVKKNLQPFFTKIAKYDVLNREKILDLILAKLNLKNPYEFKMLFGLVKKKESSLNSFVVEKIFKALDFTDRDHLELVKNIVNKENVEVPVLDLFAQYFNMGNTNHVNILRELCKNIFEKNQRDSHIVLYRKVKEKLDELNIADMSDKDKYIFQFFANELMLSMQELLTDIQNEYIEAEDNKMIIDLIGPQQFDVIIYMITILTSFESILSKETLGRFTSLKEQIAYFERMRAKEVTIEEFAEKYGFKVLQETPNVYLSSDRYPFTKVLSLLPTGILKRRVKKLAPTYFIEKEELEKQGLKTVLNKFDSYMKLLDENMNVLYKFMGLTAFDSQFDDIIKHINLMIDYLAAFNTSDANYFRTVLRDILNEIKAGKTTIAEQKSFSTGRGKTVSDITTIHRLINRIHQQANIDFVMAIRHSARSSANKVQNVFVTKGDRTIKAYNLSENKIHPNIERLLSLLAENPDFLIKKESQIFIKDNIFLWNGLLGDHSARVLIDFNRENENIFIDFTEADNNSAKSQSRISTLERMLNNFGFIAKSYNNKANLIATVSKDAGITNDTDICEMAQKAMALLSKATSLYGKNTPIEIMEPAVNDINFFNNILDYLQLPLIPNEEASLKVKKIFLFKRKKYTLSQQTIDKYVNKPIEQAFAAGYLKINDRGELERNKAYNPILTIKNKLKDMLDTDLGQTQETDMLNQGAIISQIPEQEMNFTSVGQIGGYVIKTGYMKLRDGRLNKNRGEFLAVTTLTDKNGIIRYTSSELVGFADNMNNETGRVNLNARQLKLILEQENYPINLAEKFTNGELVTYRNRLKENIVSTTTPTAYGTMISTSEGLRTVLGIVNGESDSKGLYVDKYASPDNVTEAAQYDASLFTGGSYSSHAGIILREYGKTAMIVNDSQMVGGAFRIKVYQPKGNVDNDGIFETQELQESEIELGPNDIVLIDSKDNKMMLFEQKIFKKGKTGNILFELQEYIDDQDADKVKEFINKYKDSTIVDKIIEYIYYQSADNVWLNDILSDYDKKGISVVDSADKAERIINKIQLNFNWFLPHSDSANVYRFGEKESLDASKVGTKSANQSKLYLAVEQLKKETGIDDVRVPNGFAIDYTILEDLLGQEYVNLYSQFSSIVRKKNKTEQDLQNLDEIKARIVTLINGISNNKIKDYIGKRNLKTLKDKVSIVRSSGVGEDGKSYSAAGIAESYGQVEADNIPRAIRDVLSSFFSDRATEYMAKSGHIIKPAVLIEEWIDSDKAGIIMSENSEGKGIIQVVNGIGEDIVSGRKTPYTFVTDIETGEKIDGNYTGEESLSSVMLSKLTKVTKWLEQVEGVPSDIEFLVKDNIIYIVQVRPITTLDDYTEETEVETEQQEEQEEQPVPADEIADDAAFDVSDEDFFLGDFTPFRTGKTADAKKSKSAAKKIKGKKGKKKKNIKSAKTITGVHTGDHLINDDIRQPVGRSQRDVIESNKKLAHSKDPSDSSLNLNIDQIKAVLISFGLSKKEVENIDFSEGLPDDVVSLLKNTNSQVMGTTIDPTKKLMDNLREHPILFSLAIETFLRVYEKALGGSNATFGDLLSFIEQRYSKRLYEATCTDLRGFFGEYYVANTLIAGIIPDKRAGPIIIRPMLPTDGSIMGFDIYNPVNGDKTQVKTGGSEIVHKHFGKYWFNLLDVANGICAIPVITTKNVKENSFRNDERVQGMDVTTETVTKFAHEFVAALHGIAFKTRYSSVRDLKLTDLIDNFKGFDTEKKMSVDELMNLLNKNYTGAVKKEKKTMRVIPVNETIEVAPIRLKTDFIINQDIVVNVNAEQSHVLYIDGESIFVNEEGKEEITEENCSLYGIQKVEYDDDGYISYITFNEGVTISTLNFDKKPKGSAANNVDFSDQEIKEMNSDTGTDGVIKIYLDDDVDTICHLIKEAAKSKKLIEFHFFKEGFKTSDLTQSQLLDVYKNIATLISNRFQLSDIFKSSTDYSKYTDYGLDFFLTEILKNSLLHGNLGKVEEPIAMHIDLDERKEVKGFSVYNKSKEDKDAKLDKGRETLAISAHLMLNGDSKSTEIMTLNPVREYDFDEEYEIGNNEYRKATVSLRDEIDMQLYHLERDYKKSEKNVSITDVALQTDSTVAELYRLGIEKYKKEYLEETGKTEDELTSEELIAIDQKAENYRFTFEGVLKGVKIEKYSFFSEKFLPSHSKLTPLMKTGVVITKLLAVSIGVMVTGLSFTIMSMVVYSLITKSVVIVPLVLSAISAFFGTMSAVYSGELFHLLWNAIAVITNNKKYLLQTDMNITDDSKKEKGFNHPLSKILRPVNLRKEIRDSEIPLTFVEQAKLNGAEFISIYDLVKYLGKLKRKDFRNNEGIEKYRSRTSGYTFFMHKDYYERENRYVEDSFGFALGLSYVPVFDGSKRKVNLVRGICERNNLISWERGYEYFYGKEYSAKTTEEYMDNVRRLCMDYNKKIVFFLPKNLFSHDFSFKTREELEYIQQHPELWDKIVFVFGTYDCLNIQNQETFNQYFNDNGSLEDEMRFFSTMKRLLSNPNRFMMVKDNLITKLESKGLVKFFKNTFSLSFDGMVKTAEVLTRLEYSKKQDRTENTDAVSRLRTDIEENNRRQVCFICTANINRSAVSHLLFEDRLSKLGVDNISVVSAGLLPLSEKNTDASLALEQDYEKILEDFDVEPELIERFRSEEFSKKHAGSDYFIVVSQKHKNVLAEQYNVDPDKIILYSDLDPEFTDDALPDPQKLKISKSSMVKLVRGIFDSSLFNFVSLLKMDKIVSVLIRTKSAIAQHVAVNYKNVKSTEMEQLADILETAEQQSEESNLINIYISEDIEQLQDKYELINTGIKVEDASIYKIKVGRTLVYGAKGISRLKVVNAIHESEQLKEEIKSILSLSGEIETDGIIVRNGQGIGMNEGVLEIGAMELYGKTEREEKDFMLSCLEINRAMGIMFGQKTIIGLESMGETDLDKLKTAIEKGRMRKVITEAQFKKLDLSGEYISDLRQNGIEIYLDKIDKSNEDMPDYEAMGISGEIIRDKDGIKIKDYGVGDEVEIKEILTEPDSIEKEIITSDKPIMIGVDILIEHFVKQRNIKTVQREFAALFLGKIKMNLRWGELTTTDMERIIYNIDYNKIPVLELSKPLQEYSKGDIQASLNNLLLNINENSEIGIILDTIRRSEKLKEGYLTEIIKEKILAKTALSQQNKEFGLTDKNLEKLLGHMLMLQLDNKNKEEVNLMYKSKEDTQEREMNGKDIIGKIMAEREIVDSKDGERREIAINSIIEIILVYGDDYKNRQVSLEKKDDLIIGCRAMLAAA